MKIERPTMNLRFRREWVSDDRTQRVLQQQWMIYEGDGFEEPDELEFEWRDVPMYEG